jgi:hypothetical protein
MATTFAGLWDELKAEAAAEVANLKTDAKVLEANIAPVVESDVATVLSQFKALAISLVTQFAGDAFKAVSGEEKIGTLVTAVYQAAVGAGKNIAIQDAQMFAQQAFNAVAVALAPARSASPAP